MPTIEFRGAAVSYDGQTVLHPLTATLTERRIGIIGSNGSGKSTTVRLINGLIEPTTGQVLVDALSPSTNGKEVRRRVGFVFSDAESQIIMPRVADDVAFSLRRFKLPRAEVDARVAAVLERFGLTDLAGNSPHTLSGGEKQMLALASVLVIEPETIICDEPTTLLDMRNRRRIINELEALDQQLIVVTHDLAMLEDFDRVLVINDGHLVFDGAPAEAISYYTDLMDA
ncbi:ABC transporter ATP-binding protein [Corynebacterium sp. Q4381]|uniref:energy-coupling factor ABC transporter ATP-binding protein n=1 Tax=Corynebacterium sp. Marseille-Q4381 TaxID=3121597 RepID=UPI002FE60875